MKTQNLPNEGERLVALHGYDVLDSAAEVSFDDITHLAAQICDMPIALITFVDGDRQWFKAKVGLEFSQTGRDQSLCSFAIRTPQVVTELPDLIRDSRFADVPMVVGDPNIRFYAGAPILTPAGHAMGTVCVMDKVPRALEPYMVEALKALARQVGALLELRRTVARLKTALADVADRQAQLVSYQKQLEAMNMVLVEQSATDPLTGLKNRRAFDRIMNEQSSRTERSHAPLALAIIDVDNFKSFNDEFGHVAGDEALQQVALVLQSHARTYDYVARYGGEEFALILPDTSPDAALVVAQRVCKAIESFNWNLRPITISVGVATTTTAMGSMNIVERADKALYQAKRDGRNRVVLVEDKS
jgi:diguanylate cyclase (GGDEF)-like protein